MSWLKSSEVNSDGVLWRLGNSLKGIREGGTLRGQRRQDHPEDVQDGGAEISSVHFLLGLLAGS